MNTFNLFPLQQTHFDKLAKCYEKAIEAQPNLTEPYINLGDILTKRGQLEKAINCYQKASHQKLLESRPELVENKEKTAKFSKPNFIIFGTVKVDLKKLIK
jgi:tetratricopeptide (TPR) repeat protein